MYFHQSEHIKMKNKYAKISSFSPELYKQKFNVKVVKNN